MSVPYGTQISGLKPPNISRLKTGKGFGLVNTSTLYCEGLSPAERVLNVSTCQMLTALPFGIKSAVNREFFRPSLSCGGGLCCRSFLVGLSGMMRLNILFCLRSKCPVFFCFAGFDGNVKFVWHEKGGRER